MKKYKIYTKGGDLGMTSLIGGKRVAKNHPRVEAYGTIDELNSFLGYLRDSVENECITSSLVNVQNTLMRAGSLVAVIDERIGKKLKKLKLSEIMFLEEKIDLWEEQLPPLSTFILPGGNQTVSFCHIARTVCRRAERKVLEASQDSVIDPLVLQYLNRLSDFLFVLSRKLSHELGAEEIIADI
jgi:cob(I)alamin adenosyltransferase